ncbi:MAG: hypothetical protein ACXVB0_11075 [Mucilaginibacter sp.]
MTLKKRTDKTTRLKHLLVFPLVASMMCISTHALSQSQAPQNPPPPPPPPDEVFRKINPFKKHKKDTANKKTDTTKVKQQPARPAGPPPPPNPLDLFKKKSKKDTTKKH